MGMFISDYEKRSDKAISQAIDYISMTDSGVISTFSGTTALLQSDIFTAIRIIAGDIASATIHANANTHIHDLLNKKANNATTAFNFKFALIANMLLNNDGYAHIERDKAGNVTGLRNIETSKVTIMQSDDEKEIGYQVMFPDGTKEVDYKDMIHLKAFSMDGKTGISPLYGLKPELSMLKNGNNLLSSFFKRGVNASGILRLTDSSLNNQQKKVIRESFEEVNAGAINAGGVIVLDDTQKYEQIEINTKVLDMIQNNKYSTQQIAKCFGIPLSRFGQELVNSSDSQQNDLYITSTLNMYKQMILQELSKLDVDLEMDFSTLRGVDKKTMLAKAIDKNGGSGFVKVDEVREFYGLEAIGGTNGQSIYMNSASVPLGTIKE